MNKEYRMSKVKKKNEDEYRISNKECRISKESGASRHILTIKGTAPSAHHPSTFGVRYSIFDILSLSTLKDTGISGGGFV
jgi:hypothetical protein